MSDLKYPKNSNSVIPTAIVTEALIEKSEYDLMLAELEVEKLKKLIKLLKQQRNPLLNVNLKWRLEIRKCPYLRHLATSTEISNCVAYNNSLKADRNIKLKISSTLSLMFTEGEIGRTILPGDRDYRYGLKDCFDADSENKLTILKKEVLEKIEEIKKMDLAPIEN